MSVIVEKLPVTYSGAIGGASSTVAVPMPTRVPSVSVTGAKQASGKPKKAPANRKGRAGHK
jgi:hypothetical protein